MKHNAFAVTCVTVMVGLTATAADPPKAEFPQRSHTLVTAKDGRITWKSPLNPEPRSEITIFRNGKSLGRTALKTKALRFKANPGQYSVHTEGTQYSFLVSRKDAKLIPLATTIGNQPVLLKDGKIHGRIVGADLQPAFAHVTIRQGEKLIVSRAEFDDGYFEAFGCQPGPATLTANGHPNGQLECPITITGDPTVGLPFEGALMSADDSQICTEECGMDMSNCVGFAGGLAGCGGSFGGGGGGGGGGSGFAAAGLGLLGLSAISGSSGKKNKKFVPQEEPGILKPPPAASPVHPWNYSN